MATIPHLGQLIRQADGVQRLQVTAPRVEKPLNHQSNGAAAFAASRSLHQRQAELFQQLAARQFSPTMMTRLMELGNLPQEQFAHVYLLAEALRQNEPLFEKFAKTMRTIMTRGQNVTEGLKTLLEGVDSALQTDTKSLMHTIAEALEQASNGAHRSTLAPGSEPKEAPTPGSNRSTTANAQTLSTTVKPAYAEVLATEERAHQALTNLANAPMLGQARQLADKMLITGPASPRQNLQEFLELAESSIDEFPQRFSPDLFAYTQLAKRGLSAEGYVRLAAEVPPLRLLNAIIQAEKSHQSPQAVFQSLSEEQNHGLALEGQLQRLEQLRGVTAPNLQTQPQVKPAEAQIITLRQGEFKQLDFLAIDARDGLISEKMTSFVVFPSRQEYAGPTLNLAHLPPGLYMILAKAVNSQSEIISQWTKVIIEPGDETDPDGKRKNPSKQQDAPDDDDPQTKRKFSSPLPADPLHIDVAGAPLIPLGPFLGEIILPLDYLHRAPSDLVLVGDGSGVIVSREEFLNGCFSSHAVTFRFLAEFTDLPSRKTRHALLHLKPSDTFKKFDEDLRRFVASPSSQLDPWLKNLEGFFAALGAMFPSGQQTFKVAHEMFERESKEFATGSPSSNIYQNASTEKDRKGFVSACYAKGGYAMACAGESGGALHALSYATLARPADVNPQASLGQYLTELRGIHYSQQKKDAVQNMYGIHLGHSFGSALSANPAYAPLGKNFIQAVSLALPEGPKPPTNPLAKLYCK